MASEEQQRDEVDPQGEPQTPAEPVSDPAMPAQDSAAQVPAPAEESQVPPEELPAGNPEPASPQEPPQDSPEPAAPSEEDAAELPDGAVEADAADDSGEVTINAGVLEAMLFSTHHPLTGGQLAELLDAPSTKPIRKAIRMLNEQYEHAGRCFRIEQVAGGFQMLTLPIYGEALQTLHHREADSRLTKSALETLAIVAYKQPILRADVEAIRGVASGETIRSLMEKHLVKIAGRAELPGRPILYGTTRRFLEVFGLNSLRDLPQADTQNRAGKPAVPALPPEVQANLTEEPAPAGEAELEAAAAAERTLKSVNERETEQLAQAHAADEPQAADQIIPAGTGEDVVRENGDTEAAAESPESQPLSPEDQMSPASDETSAQADSDATPSNSEPLEESEATDADNESR